MYSVRLLPIEYKMIHKQNRKREYTYIIAATLIIVLLFTYLCLSMILNSKSNELTMEQNQLENLERSINNLIELEVLEKSVAEMQGQFLTAAGNSPVWHNVLAGIGNSVPDTVGISTVNINYNGEFGEATIHGTAGKNAPVSEWITKLEEFPEISNAKFNFSSLNEGEDHFEFELTLIINAAALQTGGGSQ